MKLKNILFVIPILCLLIGQTTLAGRAPLKTVSAEPYASAFVIDADTGETLFSKNPDLPVYPASTLKLMVLLVILDQIEQGRLQLDEMVQVTVEAYKMGGSQVYLDPKEQFPLEELLYALMIQSANDAAVALASHVAGSKDAFVALMNEKANELGMKNTMFHSVHGLPPAKGQKVDVTTARDFAILSRHLSKLPEVYKYTGTKVRDFRDGEFIMRTHNHLLDKVIGCDGFKTGYFTKAGFSISATAQRNGVRLIAIVMGSKNRKVRDAQAIALLNKGFIKVPPRPKTVVAPVTPAILKSSSSEGSKEKDMASIVQSETKTVAKKEDNSCWLKFLIGVVVGFLLYGAFDFFRIKKSPRNYKRGNKLS